MDQNTIAKRKKAGLRRALWAVLAMAAAGGVAFWATRPLAVPAVRVEATTVVQTVVATGRLSPPATIEVGANQPGAVVAVSVKEGDVVDAGALLVHLDDRQLLAQRSARDEAVAQARLRIDTLRRVLSPRAVEDLKQADIAVRQAEDDANRVIVLRSAGAANDSDVTRVESALEQARSRRQGLALQAGSVGAGGVEVRTALSALNQAEAALHEVDARLVDTHLSARVKGTVLAVRADVGDTVQPGQVLVVLAAGGGLEVRAPIDEKNIAGVEPGKKALVSAEAYPDRQFPATVSRLSPLVDAVRGTIDVYLTLMSAPDFLRPDMTVSVEIELRQKAAALAVPREAVEDGPGGASLWVVESGRAVERAVELGIRGVNEAEVTRGLAPGEVVLLPGAHVLTSGIKVTPELRAAPVAEVGP